MWDLIVSVPDHGISFTLVEQLAAPAMYPRRDISDMNLIQVCNLASSKSPYKVY